WKAEIEKEGQAERGRAYQVPEVRVCPQADAALSVMRACLQVPVSDIARERNPYRIRRRWGVPGRAKAVLRRAVVHRSGSRIFRWVGVAQVQGKVRCSA